MFVSELYTMVVKLRCGEMSHGCENVSCKCMGLKNIIIKGSVKVYSMHVIKQSFIFN